MRPYLVVYADDASIEVSVVHTESVEGLRPTMTPANPARYAMNEFPAGFDGL